MMKYQVIWLYFYVLTLIVYPQQFTEYTTTTLPGVWFGSTAWGDYDNDGNLDLLLTGLTNEYEIISKLFRNDGNGNFSEQTDIYFTGVYLSSVAWGDYDNDGYLDILLTGNTSIYSNSTVSKIYRNNGNNSFTEQTSITLPGIYQGSAAWCDYNNDGKLDFMLTGQSSNDPISKIYLNNGNNTFSEQASIQITGLKNSNASWGDYNNDGTQDLLLTGHTGTSHLSKIYRNNGDNTFTEQTTISITGVSDGSASWGDYDSDGNLDILISGNTGNQSITKVYRNNADNTFTEQTELSLAGIQYGSATWGDFDNNGKLDIFLTGTSTSSPYVNSKVYLNDGLGNFFELDLISIPGVYFSSSAVGDFDNDNDLDLVLCGNSGDNLMCKIYRNECLDQNTLPTIPTNLNSIINGNDVTFFWNKSEDFETPADGLTYNLVIGTSPSNVNILSPMSDLQTGFRKVVNMGNTNHDTSWTVKNLPKGKYYWSVQAIDNNFSGSGFAQAQNFTNYLPFTELPSIQLTGIMQGSVSWGDYDNDDDLDILLTGSQLTNQGISKIYRNDGNNIFTEQTSIALIGVYASSAAWGDYDNDGYIDILLTGITSSNNRVTLIYRNNGDNTFTELSSLLIPGVSDGSVAWVDYDNDGDLDIFLTGNTGTSTISKLFRNDRNDVFNEQTAIQIIGVSSSSVAWGDYDNDGNLDFILSGRGWNGQGMTKIYRNSGSGTFIEQTDIVLPGIFLGSVSWGDYDNDGDLDILLAGVSTTVISKIFRNDGNNSFQELFTLSLPAIYEGSAVWGDYDNDGDLDILISGKTGPKIISKIYQNEGNDTFTEQKTIVLPGIYSNSLTWADYDNDEDLDILLTGFSGSNRIAIIFRNNSVIPNNKPSTPTNLSTKIVGNDVTFSWDRSTDSETNSNGLQYNLVIGTSPIGYNSLSPMSNRETGFRRIISFGNTNHDTSWTIKGLSTGTYYWSVQAIDKNYTGSNFAVSKILNLGGIRVIPEGLYNAQNDRLNLSDTLKAYLRDSIFPYEIIDSSVATIDSLSFIAKFNFLNAPSGTYYLVIKHRNSIETWSQEGGILFISGSYLTYDFTEDSSKAYGSNMVKVGNKWCIYSGDVNQDGYVEFEDINELTIANQNMQTGYVVTDLNGDRIVDIDDLVICTKNVTNFVGKIIPE